MTRSKSMTFLGASFQSMIGGLARRLCETKWAQRAENGWSS